MKQLTVDRDQLEFELRKTREQCEDQKKHLNHMEQALEKVLSVCCSDMFVVVLVVEELRELRRSSLTLIRASY